MSFSKTLFNFFTVSGNNIKIPIQQIYSIYIILHRINPVITFNQFYLYAYIIIKLFKTSNSLYLFLGFLFFSKTSQIRFLYTSNNTNFNITRLYTTTLTQPHNPTHDFFDFWKIFRKLKRPKTELSYSNYFISLFLEKINKYNTAGFLVLLDSLYLVRSKPESFLKNPIQIDKPLLTSPKYSSSSINKYLFLNSIQGLEFHFLRKNKVYNKGRYSRCRQNYRTGVYMCMYLSVVSIFGLYYWFYKFSFNFTYLWWVFISFVLSFFIPKIIKYRLYEPTTLVLKFFSIFRWFTLLVKSFLK